MIEEMHFVPTNVENPDEFRDELGGWSTEMMQV